MHWGSSEPAIDPLRAVLDPLGESEGVSVRKDTRPAVAGDVGSCSSDLISSRGYEAPGRKGGKVLIFVVIEKREVSAGNP